MSDYSPVRPRCASLGECVVIVTPRSFGVADPSLFRELAETVGEVRYRPGPLSATELMQVVKDADGLVAGLDEITAQVFSAAPRLRVVARYGVGVDRIDLAAAASHGVTVTITPGANANAVAELTIAFLFLLARPVVGGLEEARSGNWPALCGSEVAGRTLGLIGLGRVGSLVAEKAGALGMRVLAHDPNVASTTSAMLVDLERLRGDSDFISLHLPLTGATRHLVDRQFLSHVKPGTVLVNTARGELVDEEALVWALDKRLLRGAALDVLAEEPPVSAHPLLRRDDVLVTPHIAPHTFEATAAMGRMAIEELFSVLSGQRPRFEMIAPVQSR